MAINKQRLKEKYGTEQVYVVQSLNVLKVPDRFFETSQENLDWTKQGIFVFRYDAEYNTLFQQVIPYVVLTDSKMEQFYVSERISGEERLVGSYSIGFGGHINPCDGYRNVIENCIERELNEEVSAKFIKEPLRLLGTVRDLLSTTNDHIGIVYLKRVSNKTKIKIKENDKLKGKWMSIDDLYRLYGHFESWGQYIIDYFYKKHKEVTGV